MQAVKNLVLFIVLSLGFLATAQEEPQIIILDTMEYEYIENTAGKQRYLKAIAPLLRRLEIQTKSVDLKQVTPDQLALLIADIDVWTEVVEEVDKKCLDQGRRMLCEKLAQKRDDLFSFVQTNPEN